MTSVTIINQPVHVSINNVARVIRVTPQKIDVTVKPVGVQGVPGQVTDPGDLSAVFNAA